MKAENAIEVKNITKSFKVYYDKGNTIKEKVVSKNRRKYENRQVLKDISFDVKKGEAIGLIGQNGCGKSTTLKLLTRIMYPDSGTIEMKGRVSSLIELGAGFHPDMSGRENIFINASIFGLTKKEIEARVDDIIAFSELEEFIDNPVRTYSSGMYMRLAFAVAINVDADILLIDEILAVGDANFQAKCFNRLREIKANGTTIVIVSHSLGQIEQICERSIWIRDGLIQAEGSPRVVHPEYLAYMGEKRQEIAEKEMQRQEEIAKKNNEKAKQEQNAGEENTDSVKEDAVESEKTEESVSVIEENTATAEEKKRWGNEKAKISKVSMLDKKGKSKVVFATGDTLKVKIEYRLKEKVVNAVFGVGFFRSDGIQCYGTNTRLDGMDDFDLTASGTAIIEFEKMNLLPGKYTLDIAIESDLGVPVDYYREAASFEVFSVIDDVGVTRMDHSWQI